MSFSSRHQYYNLKQCIFPSTSHLLSKIYFSAEFGSKVCHWFVYAKPGHRILLYFSEFEVEGKPNGKRLNHR